MPAMAVSIANAVSDGTIILNRDTNPFPQEICTRDLNSEFEDLESTGGVHAARAATATLHKDWLDIKPEDVSVQKGWSNLFSPAQARKPKKEQQAEKSLEAFKKYCDQGEPGMCDDRANLIQICQI